VLGAEIWAFRKVGQNYMESFEIRWWSRMKKISWTDRVRHEEELPNVQENINISQRVKRRKVNLIGQM
jgi:hypothetical protein